jgi:hypothetical protein
VVGACGGFLPNYYASAFVLRGEKRSVRPERFSFEGALGVISR